MNTELFIAKRLFFDKKSSNGLSKRIINIALVGIALGLAVMILSVSIVTGFKNEIRDKVIGFGSHIQIINFDSNYSYETQPIEKNQPFLSKIKQIENISSINIFGTKPGIIKTENSIQGINFKGVSEDYNWSFFEKHLIQGTIPEFDDTARSNKILISQKVTQLLKLSIGDPVVTVFINKDERNPRIMQFIIGGIYNTGLEEFDNIFIIGDIKNIQRLNNWDQNQVSGFEVSLVNFDQLEQSESQIRDLVINYNEDPGTALRTISIPRKYPQIFDWLAILDMNVWVILTLMVLVAGFNMISALLVLILERISMVGILKSMGSPNWSIRKTFLYLSGFLISRGLIWGNIIGIVILLLQKYFKIIPLDPASYFVEVVPVNFSIPDILLLNIGTMTIVLIILLVPSYYISKISPEKTIRFN